MAQTGASVAKVVSADEVLAIVRAHFGERLFIVLPEGDDHRMRASYGLFEARVWEGKRAYVYEIVSRNVVLARGEAGSAYTALERTVSLLVMLSECSGSERYRFS